MNFISIGPVVANKIKNQVETLLTQYLKEIDEAYTKADNTLTVAFSVKLSLPALQRGILVETQISFVESRIKDVMGTIIDEKQMKLFEGKAA